MAALFLLAPAAISLAVYRLGVPLFIVLQPVLIAFIAYLLWDRTFSLRRELAHGFSIAEAGRILALAAMMGLLLALATRSLFPELYLALPLRLPRLWLFVIVLYPLLSVVAQELVYRTFFFHRYGPLLAGRPIAAIVLNAALFGFGHVIFGNWIAVAGSTLVGALIAWTYLRTRSFWAVWLEHSLYGGMVFTVGLGRFFFTGVSNL
jgi:membrane protease YdiL (CAAX protease family)